MTSIRDPYELSQAYFPWLYVGGKFRTEILSRNAIPPHHLKKKNCGRKEKQSFFIAFSLVMEKVGGEESVDKKGRLIGRIVCFISRL